MKLVLVLFFLLLESLTFTPEFTNDDGKSFGVSALLAKPNAKGQSFSVKTCKEFFNNVLALAPKMFMQQDLRISCIKLRLIFSFRVTWKIHWDTMKSACKCNLT